MGFIRLCVRVGLLNLAFIHIIVHALFKSMLFISIGAIICNNEHYQDIRLLGIGIINNKLRSNILYVGTLCLLGLPILRSFYSKDLVLETLSFSEIRFIIELFIYISIIFRFYYRIKLFNFIYKELSGNSYKIDNKASIALSFFIILMIVINLFRYKIIINFISMECVFFTPVNSFNKIILFTIIIFIIACFILISNMLNFFNSKYLYFNNIINLNFVTKRFMNIFYFIVIKNLFISESLLNKFTILDAIRLKKILLSKVYGILFVTNLFSYLAIIFLFIVIVA